MPTVDIEHKAHLLGAYLAERTLGRILRSDSAMPSEWPGSIDDARRVAAEFSDPEDCDTLAERVLGQASMAWERLRASR